MKNENHTFIRVIFAFAVGVITSACIISNENDQIVIQDVKVYCNSLII